MITKLVCIFIAILLSSCSLKFTNSNFSLEEQQKIFTKLPLVTSIRASLDIKATGLLGHFFHEQGQIISQEPQNLFFFINTSLGLPSILIACNGSFLTMYNYLQDGEYNSYPLAKKTYFNLYDTVVYPEILINFILNRLYLNNLSNIDILQNKNYYQVQAQKDQWMLKANIEKNRHVITEIFWQNKDTKLQYHVVYGDFKLISGIYFPHEMVFKTIDADKSSSFKFLLNEVILNDPYQDESIFYLQAPK